MLALSQDVRRCVGGARVSSRVMVVVYMAESPREVEGEFFEPQKPVAMEERPSPDPECHIHITAHDNTQGGEERKKGILKHVRSNSNKHVDFNMDLEFVPFDEAKDFTIDIQIVETMPKKVISYAALFAEQKAQEDAEQNVKQEGKVVKHLHSSNDKKHNHHINSKPCELHKTESKGLKVKVSKDTAVVKHQVHNVKRSDVSVDTKEEGSHCLSGDTPNGTENTICKEESLSSESCPHCGATNGKSVLHGKAQEDTRAGEPPRTGEPTKDRVNGISEPNSGEKEDNSSEPNILQDLFQSDIKLGNMNKSQEEYKDCINLEPSTGEILKEVIETTKSERNAVTDSQNKKEIQNIKCINEQKRPSVMVEGNLTPCDQYVLPLCTCEVHNEQVSTYEETETSVDDDILNKTEDTAGKKMEPTNVSAGQVKDPNKQTDIGLTEVNNERNNLEINCTVCDFQKRIPSEVCNDCNLMDIREINNNQHPPGGIVNNLISNEDCEKLDLVERSLENKESEIQNNIILNRIIPDKIEKLTLSEAVGKVSTTNCTCNEHCGDLPQDNGNYILNVLSRRQDPQLPVILINGWEKDNEKIVKNKSEENANCGIFENDFKVGKFIPNDENETFVSLEGGEVTSKLSEAFDLGEGRVSEER